MPNEAHRPSNDLRPDAVGTVVWGRAHGDARFEAWGREVLGRVGATGA